MAQNSESYRAGRDSADQILALDYHLGEGSNMLAIIFLVHHTLSFQRFDVVHHEN